jgi:hypothetical protein
LGLLDSGSYGWFECFGIPFVHRVFCFRSTFTTNPCKVSYVAQRKPGGSDELKHKPHISDD